MAGKSRSVIRIITSLRLPLQGPRGGASNFHRRLLLALIVSALAVSVLMPPVVADTEESVLVADIEGVIDPAVAEYVNISIKAAERANAEALVIRMDTPGGLDTSMRSIIKDIFDSEVPVVVYVSPSGARAASAGAFITLAAHVAAMAPVTNIGAAHPVSMFGEMPEDVEAKVVNDAVAYIRGIAKKTNRNESWAEDAVRKSVSVPSDRALELNVIDYVAPDLEALLNRIDGKSVSTTAGLVVLKTKDADIIEHPMSLRQRLLHILADPNVAYLLLILGFYGILYEFASPGLGLSGIGGLISIVLGLYSLQVVPVNYAGLVLIVLGIGLLIAEAVNPGFGVLGAGGIISMAIGSFVLFESPIPGLRASPFIVIPTILATAAFVIFATRMALHARRQKPITGMEGMVGLIGEVRRRLDPVGEIFVRGELWRAESLGGTVDEGEKVKVVAVNGLKLKVKRLSKGRTIMKEDD